MATKRISRRSFLKRSILTASAVVLAAHTSAVTAAPDPAPAAAALHPTLNETMTAAQVIPALPRKETLYFNGQQWGPINGWNPYSSNMNNAMVIAEQDNARITVFETPYMYNMLDGKLYPLLADGDYTWNAQRTAITFKIKTAAKWSDGSAVTAEDVAYTWASHVKFQTPVFNNFMEYIYDITAQDAQTVLVYAKLSNNGKAINPLMVSSYLSTNYVIQKAWTQTLESRSINAAAFLTDPALDFIASGPYHNYPDLTNDQIVVLVRDDNYWGKDASMWGKLPAPKYLAHTIFADNNTGQAAFNGRSGRRQPAVHSQCSRFVAGGSSTHLDLPARCSLSHWRQPADLLLQPEGLRFGSALRSVRRSPLRLTMTRSSPTP